MENRSDIIYFDHAAATPARSELWPLLPELAMRCYANPEAAHRLASEVRRLLEDAGQRLAAAVFGRALPECRVVFGGSASELLALLGSLKHPAHSAGVGSPLEHPAVLAMLRRSFGIVHRMAVDRDGLWQLPAVPDGAVALAAASWVQSEIGLIQPLDRMLPELRRAFPEALLLVDAVQGAGKLEFPAVLPDLAVISGHKFGAPGGAALLLLSPAARQLEPALAKLRRDDYLTGRAEPLNALLLTRAAELAAAERKLNFERVAALERLLRAGLANLELPVGKEVVFTAAEERSSPYILHFVLPGYDSGVLVRMLSQRDIMVAAGSACRAESKTPSAALTALGVPRRLGHSGLRLSFSPGNTVSEAQTFLKVLPEVLRDY